jgi:UDP-glucose 4-epimerase
MSHLAALVPKASIAPVSKRAILVAGGAGYIGSHFCHVAARRGFSPVVVDRIGPSTERVAAYRRSIARHFPLEVCDIADEARVARLVEQHAPVAAVCFAALIEVGESVANPPLFWDNNYVGAMRFFRTLTRGGIRHLVFSSTAAVYDSTTGARLLAEGDGLSPASPYGLTKLACELALQGSTASHSVAPGVGFGPLAVDWPPLPTIPAQRAPHIPPSSLVMRYFNAAGADPAAGLGEVHEPESHLIPNALRAVLQAARGETGAGLTMFGEDYPTEDGTCVRDYVHVLDLAEAHVAGLEYLLRGGSSDVVNLGCGSGYSIKQVITAIEKVSGSKVPMRVGPRRPGDSARLVADVRKARDLLGWQPSRNLHEIVASALEFHGRHGV